MDVGDAPLDGGKRLAPECVHVAVLGGHRGGRARRAAEVERDGAGLERLDLRERLGEPVELARVIERLGRRPHAAQHVQIFVGAAIARVVVEPVAVTRLLGIAAARDDVQSDATVRHVVQRGRSACGQRGRHEAGPVRDEVAQPLGVRGSIPRHRKPLGRRRGVPDEHAVEAGLLVSLGEGAQPLRVDGAADHVHGRAVRPLRLHPDHADDLDGHGGDPIPWAPISSTAR